jgi:F420H(2)-dependent quinone reductase
MLFYLEDGANLAVVASNAGASSEPAWLLNLRETPEAFVDLPDGVHAVRGRVATVQEQGRLWHRFESLLAAYATYAAATQRVIPVVILEPTEAERRASSGG